jgi:hypothetical protein
LAKWYKSPVPRLGICPGRRAAYLWGSGLCVRFRSVSEGIIKALVPGDLTLVFKGPGRVKIQTIRLTDLPSAI